MIVSVSVCHWCEWDEESHAIVAMNAELLESSAQILPLSLSVHEYFHLHHGSCTSLRRQIDLYGPPHHTTPEAQMECLGSDRSMHTYDMRVLYCTVEITAISGCKPSAVACHSIMPWMLRPSLNPPFSLHLHIYRPHDSITIHFISLLDNQLSPYLLFLLTKTLH